MSKKYEKKYGKGYLSRVGDNNYWITDDNAYKLTNNDNNKSNRDNNKSNRDGFTFTQIYRLVVGVILIMVLALGFGNGTFEFLNDYKTTYAVENYVKPNITSFADVDGNTFKFNDDVYLYDLGATNPKSNNFSLDLNTDNISLITNDVLLFTLHNSTQSYDFYVRPTWTGVNYRVILNGYLRGFSFRNIGRMLVYYGYYNNDNILEWNTDYFNNINDDFYITFSNDFSTYIIGANSNISFNERAFYNFLNYQTTIKNDIYSDDFYYYDWRFKLNQLSNFRPLFYADDVLNNYDANRLYSPENYYSILKDYYEKGYVNYSSVPMPNGRNWYITLTGYVHLDDNSADDFINYLTGYRDALITDLYACDCFYIDNGIVVPIDASYEAWQSIYYGKYNSGFGFINGIIGFLNAPINFTYNVYVFFDFILRW